MLGTEPSILLWFGNSVNKSFQTVLLAFIFAELPTEDHRQVFQENFVNSLRQIEIGVLLSNS